MSPHPILSLKPSMGRKSRSSFHAGAFSFQPSSSAQVSAECFAYHQENQSAHLHSSWISRLLPTSATSSSSELFSEKLTIASGESRATSSSNFSIIRGYLGFGPMKPVSISKISRGDRDVDGDFGLLAGFGPFKVREARKSDVSVFGEGGEERGKLKGCVLESQISKLEVQYESRLDRADARVLREGMSGVYPVSLSRSQSCFGPWKVGGEMKMPFYGALVASGGSGLDDARRRGVAYRGINHGGSAPRSLLDVHNLCDNVMPQQPCIQARKIEAEEPFSFWNMGRVKRANFVSSVSPSFDLSWTFDRKRKLNAEDINCFKYRRM